MYEAFVTEKPNRQKDGMVHVTVEFRADGLPTVERKTFTDSFSVEWFKEWCAKQIEGLDRPQELTVEPGKLDVSNVSLEPTADTKAQREFSEKLSRLERLQRIAKTGVIADDHSEIVKLQGELVEMIAAKPKLLK